MTSCVRNVQGLRLMTKRNGNDVLRAEEKKVQIVKKSVAGLRVVGGVRESVAGGGARRLFVVPQIQAVGEAVTAKTAADEPTPEMAFYRKYTEALLRRYTKMSMEAGRVPSLLGKEMFRGNVTSYRVSSFEDVVIFCYDVERCLKVLNKQEGELVKRIAMQQYTKAEAAAAVGMSLRWCVVQYAAALTS